MRRRVAVVGLLLGTAAGALPAPEAACACECLPVTPTEARAEAGFIFVGTVRRLIGTKDPDSPEPVTYEFSVERVIKGARVTRVQTNASADACGVEFEVGRRYVVYAVDSGGVLFVSQCGGTRLLTAGDAKSPVGKLGRSGLVAGYCSAA
ncbi:hypothetical protein FL583_17805 [Cryptosporangium phraense]|uniref:Tissue inhibitor of metalloproteinase n=1 Tax=Cryptosporangium phraense TaxID=2593070 RepID=A0A545ARB5_9ACTN|nr:hypothetical protein FL583_17805 [Cryptosporangium phraense]